MYECISKFWILIGGANFQCWKYSYNTSLMSKGRKNIPWHTTNMRTCTSWPPVLYMKDKINKLPKHHNSTTPTWCKYFVLDVLCCMYLVTLHHWHTQWNQTGETQLSGSLILPCCALINSTGEIQCSDAFTVHLWAPHTLSSQPNFHHQTQCLIRLTRIWGLLLYAWGSGCVWAPLWHELQLHLCCIHTEAKLGGAVSVSSLPGCFGAWLEASVAPVVGHH